MNLVYQNCNYATEKKFSVQGTFNLSAILYNSSLFIKLPSHDFVKKYANFDLFDLQRMLLLVLFTIACGLCHVFLL